MCFLMFSVFSQAMFMLDHCCIHPAPQETNIEMLTASILHDSVLVSFFPVISFPGRF